jgi:hypothetical protein
VRDMFNKVSKGLKVSLGSAAMAASILGATGATASVVIYDNAQSAIDAAYITDQAFSQYVATRVDLNDPTSFDMVQFEGVYGINNIAPSGSQFELAVFADDGGTPDSTALEIRTFEAVRGDTGQDAFGYDVYNFEALFGDITLAPGTYWVALVNRTVSPDGQGFAWAGSATDGVSAARTSRTARWLNGGTFDPSFSLVDAVTAASPNADPSAAPLTPSGSGGSAPVTAVPLPASGFVLLAGVLALGTRRKGWFRRR